MKVGILGSTGVVGMQMLKCLEERNIDVTELKLFSSKKSAGNIVKFKDADIIIEEATENSFKGLDVVLGAVSNDLSKKFSKFIVDSNACFIDNSSAYRLDENVPLIIPEINKEDIKKHNGIISNPNCSTIITLMAVAPINKLSKIKNMIATTFQAVSGAGINGIYELENQMKEIIDNNIDCLYSNDNELIHEKFSHQIAYNVIPGIGNILDNSYTTEEMKMQNEGRKILHNDKLNVTCTCVRIPVIRSHSISVSVQTENKLSINDIYNSINNFPNVKLVDDYKNSIFPMPLKTCNKDLVEIGRIRNDLVLDNGISLFCAGDQIRKGAATNAVQILESL